MASRPEWKVKRFKNPAQQKWFPGETISVGVGQGYNSYTPLQLAQSVMIRSILCPATPPAALI